MGISAAALKRTQYTNAGENSVTLTPDSFTAEFSKYFLIALQHPFGKDLVIVWEHAVFYRQGYLDRPSQKGSHTSDAVWWSVSVKWGSSSEGGTD